MGWGRIKGGGGWMGWMEPELNLNLVIRNQFSNRNPSLFSMCQFIPLIGEGRGGEYLIAPMNF